MNTMYLSKGNLEKLGYWKQKRARKKYYDTEFRASEEVEDNNYILYRKKVLNNAMK